MADESDRIEGPEPEPETPVETPAEPEMPAAPADRPEAPAEPAAEPEMPGDPIAQPDAPSGTTAETDMAGLAPEDEVAAITASLEEPELAEESSVPASEGAAATAEVPVSDGAAPSPAAAATDASAPADTASEPREIDLGPEGQSRWWLWVLSVLGVVGVIAAGWALWYFFLSPVSVPRVVGKDLGRAAQALNDANVRLGRTSEVPTSSAPVGTVIEQSPAAGAEVDRDAEVALVIAAPPTTSAIPEVSGQKVEVAQQTLAKEDLGTTIVETYDPTVASGMVISQLPTAGAEVPPGTLIAIAVSKGPAPSTATVPDLRGITTEDAQRILAALDLVAAGYRSADASVPAGQIATQTPVPGTRVSARSTVMFLLSEGRAFNAVTVPDVSNSDRKDAIARMKAAGLVAKTRQVAHASVPVGRVIAQMPPAGAKVARNTNVGVLISRGPNEAVPVPSVVGTDQASAAKAITAAGFKPVVLPTPFAEGVAGRVVAQWPLPQTPWTPYLPVIALYRQ